MSGLSLLLMPSLAVAVGSILGSSLYHKCLAPLNGTQHQTRKSELHLSWTCRIRTSPTETYYPRQAMIMNLKSGDGAGYLSLSQRMSLRSADFEIAVFAPAATEDRLLLKYYEEVLLMLASPTTINDSTPAIQPVRIRSIVPDSLASQL